MAKEERVSSDTRPKTSETVVKDAKCLECSCDALLPLVKIRTVQSFSSGDHVQIEWPYRSGSPGEYAKVACPACGLIMAISAGGAITSSGLRLMQMRQESPILKRKKK